MAGPTAIPGMQMPANGVVTSVEAAPGKGVVHAEDILSARLKTDIEGFATPFAWMVVAFLIGLWVRRFAKEKRQEAGSAQ